MGRAAGGSAFPLCPAVKEAGAAARAWPQGFGRPGRVAHALAPRVPQARLNPLSEMDGLADLMGERVLECHWQPFNWSLFGDEIRCQSGPYSSGSMPML